MGKCNRATVTFERSSVTFRPRAGCETAMSNARSIGSAGPCRRARVYSVGTSTHQTAAASKDPRHHRDTSTAAAEPRLAGLARTGYESRRPPGWCATPRSFAPRSARCPPPKAAPVALGAVDALIQHGPPPERGRKDKNFPWPAQPPASPATAPSPLGPDGKPPARDPIEDHWPARRAINWSRNSSPHRMAANSPT